MILTLYKGVFSMNKVKTKARQFVKDLDNMRLTSDELKSIIVHQGYQLIMFNPYANEPEAQLIIDTFNLNDMCHFKKCFVYSDTYNKYVFLCDNLAEQDVYILLLHELGHILLEHTQTSGNEIKQEYDANLFVLYVNMYINRLRIFTYSKKIFKYLFLYTFFIIICIYLFKSLYSQTFFQNTVAPIVETEPQYANEYVIVTRTGKKYHHSGCRHIIGRETISILKYYNKTIFKVLTTF